MTRPAPATPVQAWAAFVREMAAALALVAGLAALWLLASGADSRTAMQVRADLPWLAESVVLAVALVLVYEVWLLRTRLAALRAGARHVEPDETDRPQRRRRGATQRRRDAKFRRELILVSLACGALAAVAGLALALELRAGLPANGPAGRLLLGAGLAWAALVVLTWYNRDDRTGGRS